MRWWSRSRAAPFRRSRRSRSRSPHSSGCSAAGAKQILFKYCSTFDSTDQGNIGPVADALLDALGADFTVFCPAFPENGRTIYQGYLFVGDGLLSESGMRDHPLTPMRDANLRRVLGRQTPHKVGLVPLATVSHGATAVRAEFDRLRREGCRHAILDAVQDGDLLTLGEAAAGLSLVTGGSGIALGLPENFRRAGLLEPVQHADRLPVVRGRGGGHLRLVLDRHPGAGGGDARDASGFRGRSAGARRRRARCKARARLGGPASRRQAAADLGERRA